MGQEYCWNCQLKFQYNCPNCHAPVEPIIVNCPYCRIVLPWPKQQNQSYRNDDSRISRQFEGDFKSRDQIPKQRNVNLTSIIVIVIAAIVIISGSIYAINYFSRGETPVAAPQNPPPKTESPPPVNQPPPPLPQNPTAEDKKTPVITDMLVKINEVPAGWIQENINPSGIREWDIYSDIKKPVGEAAVRFINDKTAPSEKQVTLNNHIILFGDKQSGLNYIKTKEELYKYAVSDTVQAINLGDGGFSRIVRGKLDTPHMENGNPVFPQTIRLACFLYFTKGTYYIDLYYYCPSLSNISDEDISTFTYNLAKKVEERIPASK